MTLAETALGGRSTGLPDYVLENLRGIFLGHPVVQGVVLYGSRAKGNFRPNSDIDLMNDELLDHVKRVGIRLL